VKTLVFAAACIAASFSFGDAYAKYQGRPKSHFLSWESGRRHDEMKKYKRYTMSSRRIDISGEKVIRLKKSKFWNSRPYQFSTPHVAQDMMFVGADSGYFYGIDARLRRKLWTFKTEGAVHSEAEFDGGIVFFGDCKGMLYALDGGTGKEKWRTTLDTTIISKPLVSGDRLYVTTMSGRLYAVDRDTGVEIWHTGENDRAFGFSVRRDANPVLIGDRIFIGTSTGMLMAYRASDGLLSWAKQLGDKQSLVYDVDSRPLFVDGKIFASSADGRLFCIDPQDGGIVWDVEAGGTSDPILYEGRIFASGGNSLFSVDPATGSVVWQQELDDPGLSSPAAGKRYIAVAGTTDKIYLIDSDTGDVIQERYIRKGAFGDPVIVGDMIYVLSNSGRLFTFKTKELKPRKVMQANAKKTGKAHRKTR
jgi:outer membrane protein assembly factor BamB